jgi:hypothetical protein
MVGLEVKDDQLSGRARHPSLVTTALPEESHRFTLWKFRFSATNASPRDCRLAAGFALGKSGGQANKGKRSGVSGKPNYPQDKPAGFAAST